MTASLYFQNISKVEVAFLESCNLLAQNKIVSFKKYSAVNKHEKDISPLFYAVLSGNVRAISLLLGCADKFSNDLRISRHLVETYHFLHEKQQYIAVVNQYLNVFLKHGFCKEKKSYHADLSMVLSIVNITNDAVCLGALLDFMQGQGFDINKQHEVTTTAGVYKNRLIEMVFFGERTDRSNDIEMLKLLLERGANPEVMGLFEQSFFYGCLRRGRLDLMGCMLEAGKITNIDHITQRGQTALHEACHAADMKAVTMLLSYGANPLVQLPNGLNCISLALEDQNFELLDMFNQDKKSLNEATVLMRVENEYGKKVTVNVPCIYLVTLPDFKKDEDFFRQMVARGFDIQHEHPVAYTAFHQVAYDIELVRLFIKFGLEINRHYCGIRPIHSVIQHRADKAVLEEVIKAGAEVHAMPGDNYSPLELAINQGYTGLAEVLIANGADVNYPCIALPLSLLCEAVLSYDLNLIKLITSHKNFIPLLHARITTIDGYLLVTPLIQAIVRSYHKKNAMVVIKHLMDFYEPISPVMPSALFCTAGSSEALFKDLVDHLVNVSGVELVLSHLKLIEQVLSAGELNLEKDDESGNAFYHSNELFMLDMNERPGLKANMLVLLNATFERLSNKTNTTTNSLDAFELNQASLSSATKGLSSFSFLIHDRGWTPGLFKQIRSQNDKVPRLLPGLSQHDEDELPDHQWFGGALTSLSELLKCIEGDGSSGISYLYLDKDEILKQGCSEQSFKLFHAGPFRFNELSIKGLKDVNFKMSFIINGQLYADVSVSHELKIPGKERILLFRFTSIDGRASVYMNGPYLGNGLHNNKDIKQLCARKNMKPMTFDFENDHKVEPIIRRPTQ